MDDRCKHSTSDRDRVDSRYSRSSNSDAAPLRHTDKSHLDRHKMAYATNSPNCNATSHRTSTSHRNNSHSDSANSHKDSTFSDVRKNSSHSYSSAEAALRRQRHESEGSRSSYGHTTPHKNDGE